MEEKQTMTKTNSDSKYKWTIAVLVLIIVAMGSYTLGLKSSTGGAVVNTNPTGQVVQQQPTKVDIQLTGDEHVLGDPNAEVTVVEYSDFQCPFCGRFYSETVTQIKANYVDSGKVKFVYKHFPLSSIHPEATPSAIASECAAEQGKFWEYHDMLFENQAALGNANYKQWAADLGLDTKQFNDCLDTQKYADKVNADFVEGQQYGVRGTPATFVNGMLVSGAQPYTVFQQAIESEL